MKKLFTIMSVVVAALLLVSCGSPSPKDVTNSYYKALQKGDFEKALSYTTMVDDQEIQKEINKFEGMEFKIPEYEILSEEISEDGQTAVVEVKYKFTSAFNSEPEETTNKVTLVKQDGKWKVKS